MGFQYSQTGRDGGETKQLSAKSYHRSVERTPLRAGRPEAAGAPVGPRASQRQPTEGAAPDLPSASSTLRLRQHTKEISKISTDLLSREEETNLTILVIQISNCFSGKFIQRI